MQLSLKSVFFLLPAGLLLFLSTPFLPTAMLKSAGRTTTKDATHRWQQNVKHISQKQTTVIRPEERNYTYLTFPNKVRVFILCFPYLQLSFPYLFSINETLSQLFLGDLSPNTVLVLVNAIYFKSFWQNEPTPTPSKSFSPRSGLDKQVPTLEQTEVYTAGECSHVGAKFVHMDFKVSFFFSTL